MPEFVPRPLALPAATILFAFAAMASNQYHTLLMELGKGFEADEIGTAVMLGALTQAVLPFAVLRLGLWIRTPDTILRFAYLGLAVGLVLLPHAPGHLSTLLSFVWVSICLNVATTLQSTLLIASARPHGDGWTFWLRSMGTFGYACACLISSWAAPAWGLPNLYLLFAGFACLAAVSSWSAGNRIEVPRTPFLLKDILSRLWEPETRRVILTVALANGSIYGGVTYLGNFIHHEMHGDDGMVGRAWTIATFSEMPLIWLGILVLRRTGLKWLMLIGMLSSTLRLALTWGSHEHWVFYASQVLHGLFYGVSLSGVGIFLARRHGAEHLHGLQLIAQVVYGGLATAIGGKLAGWIWHTQGLRAVYLWTSLGALAAVLWFAWKVRDPERFTKNPSGKEPGYRVS